MQHGTLLTSDLALATLMPCITMLMSHGYLHVDADRIRARLPGYRRALAPGGPGALTSGQCNDILQVVHASFAVQACCCCCCTS